MARERVAILVTHLLGAGHLVRAAALGRALARGGHDVLLLSGGTPAPLVATAGLHFHQLPPLKVEGTDFSRLLLQDGSPADGEWLAARTGELIHALRSFRPTVFVTELFPFGRRALRSEFIAALETAAAMRPRPAILCSVRDVLAPPSRPEKAGYAEELLGRFFEAVLVHGEAEAIPLERSWPVSPALARRLVYTGYVEDPEQSALLAAGERSDDLVVVSGGASSAGIPLFRAALDAAARLAGSHRFHILVGHGVDEAQFQALVGRARGMPVVVERARADFRQLLGRAGVSVSRAGYNTVLDLAATGVAAVLVPFEEGGEEEQRIRAEALAAAGVAEAVAESELSGARLAAAIVTAGKSTGRRAFAPRRDGAQRSAAAVLRFAGAAHDREEALRGLEAALGDVRPAGRRIAFWWRDDDAVAPTPALDRLLALRERLRLPLALASVPARAEPTLARIVEAIPEVDVLVHGFGHANHAAPSTKKQELQASRGIGTVRQELVDGLARLKCLFGDAALPVLVPPWNRIDEALIDLLPEIGYRALSAFAGRYDGQGPSGLIRIDAHIDPIDWRAGGCAPAAQSLREAEQWVRRVSESAPASPLGVLTHHLQHDPWVWGFVEEFLVFLVAQPGVEFVSVRDVLARTDSAFAASRRVAKASGLA